MLDARRPSWDNEWQEIPGPEAVLIGVGAEPGAAAASRARRWPRSPTLRKTDPIDTLFDILIEDQAYTYVAVFGMSEPDVALALAQPWVSINNDSQGTSPDGLLGQEHPHPRAYGTFPRILRKYVREEKRLTLEDAIRKFTSLPAQRMRLADRGVLKVGMWADVVVFDPAQVRDLATFAEPNQLSEGMEYVLVNGVPVIADGKATGRCRDGCCGGGGWSERGRPAVERRRWTSPDFERIADVADFERIAAMYRPERAPTLRDPRALGMTRPEAATSPAPPTPIVSRMPVDVTSEIGQLADRAGAHARPRARGGDARQPRRLPLRRHHRPRDRPAGAPAVRLGAPPVRAACSRCASCSPTSWRSPRRASSSSPRRWTWSPSDELAQRLATLPAGADRRDADRGHARGERPARAGAQRGRLRLSAAAQPLLSPRHRDGDRAARGGRRRCATTCAGPRSC